MKRLVLVLVLLLAAPAQAARVGYERTSEGYRVLRVIGDPGEASNLTVSRDAGASVVSDGGSPLRAGEGCAQVDERTVRCEGSAVPWLQLGDGDDRAQVAPGSAAQLHAEGGAGDDVLVGGAGADMMMGSAGNDVVFAHDGGGVDAPDDIDAEVVTYRGRKAPLRADLAARRAGADYVTGVDELIGGSGRDVLRGSARDEVLWGGDPGDRAGDTLVGRGGDDILRGTAGRDVMRGGDADDGLYGLQGPDRYDGGAGDDTLDFPLRSRTDPGVVRCGPGRDLLFVPPRIAQPRDCEGRGFHNTSVWLEPERDRVTVRHDYPGAWCRVALDLRTGGRVRTLRFDGLRHGRPRTRRIYGLEAVTAVALRGSYRCRGLLPRGGDPPVLRWRRAG